MNKLKLEPPMLKVRTFLAFASALRSFWRIFFRSAGGRPATAASASSAAAFGGESWSLM